MSRFQRVTRPTVYGIDNSVHHQPARPIPPGPPSNIAQPKMFGSLSPTPLHPVSGQITQLRPACGTLSYPKPPSSLPMPPTTPVVVTQGGAGTPHGCAAMSIRPTPSGIQSRTGLSPTSTPSVVTMSKVSVDKPTRVNPVQFNAWLAVETEGRSLQILLLPPVSFHSMVDEGIMKVNAAKDARKTYPPHGLVDHYIIRQEQQTRGKVAEVKSVPRKKEKNVTKGILSFCMSSPKSSNAPEGGGGSPIGGAQSESRDENQRPGILSEYPYQGLDDEDIKSLTPFKAQPSRQKLFAHPSRPSRPNAARQVDQWNELANFNAHLLAEGIASPKSFKQPKEYYSISGEDVPPAKPTPNGPRRTDMGTRPARSFPGGLGQNTNPQSKASKRRSPGQIQSDPRRGSTVSSPSGRSSRRCDFMGGHSQGIPMDPPRLLPPSPTKSRNDRSPTTGFYTPMSEEGKTRPPRFTKELTPTNLQIHNMSTRPTHRAPGSILAPGASEQAGPTLYDGSDVGSYQLTMEESMILDAAKKILQNKRYDTSSYAPTISSRGHQSRHHSRPFTGTDPHPDLYPQRFHPSRDMDPTDSSTHREPHHHRSSTLSSVRREASPNEQGIPHKRHRGREEDAGHVAELLRRGFKQQEDMFLKLAQMLLKEKEATQGDIETVNQADSDYG